MSEIDKSVAVETPDGPPGIRRRRKDGELKQAKRTFALPPAPLTQRQAEVYHFIANFIKTNGVAPTVREIGRHFKMVGTNAVAGHLRALTRTGYISVISRSARSIRLGGYEAPALVQPKSITLGILEARGGFIRLAIPDRLVTASEALSFAHDLAKVSAALKKDIDETMARRGVGNARET